MRLPEIAIEHMFGREREFRYCVAQATEGHPVDGRQDLTDRQRQILDLIGATVRERGYPPSVREIGDAVGLSSPSTVHSHLSALERGGLPSPRPHQTPRD